MKLTLSYCEGYGWHCGRLRLWPALFFAGIFAAMIGLLLEMVLALAAGIRLPISFLAPVAFGVLLWRRLRRKMAGEPFAWDPPFTDSDTVSLIRRSQRPRAFWWLFGFEVVMWGSSIIAQVFLLVSRYLLPRLS